MTELTIALAQSASERGNIEENVSRHQRLIALAVKSHARVIAFPELSLTGYEPDLAANLAFTLVDERLYPLKALAAKHRMVILVGAPYKGELGLHIGTFLLFPDGSVSLYTKRYLHPGEEKFFVSGAENPFIQIGREKIAIAVCADLANPQHAEDAAKAGCTLYLVSAFISPGGYETDANILKGYAQKHHMEVLLSNYSGTSGGIESAGRSAGWLSNGDLIAEYRGNGEGLLIVSKENELWKGKALALNR